MLPSSHEVAIKAQSGEQGPLLIEAFSKFIDASSRLEISYRNLQTEVTELSHTLAERNRALSESLSENRNLGERLQHILDTVPCGVMVAAEDGSVRLANPEAHRLLGLSTSNVATSLQPSPVTLGLRLETQSPNSADADEAEQELSFETPDGRVWVALRKVDLPSAAAGSDTAEAVLTLRDITAKKRMEEEREMARDAVALAQISALLAHEIRNPLASLELFAGLLEDSPERHAEWLSHLRAGIRALSGTVNNVLALHSNTPLVLETLDVLAELRLAVQFLQPMAQQAQVALSFVTEPPAGPLRPSARGNRSAFHQILINLCSNALRHTPAGGSVSVRCTVPGSPRTPFRILVSDTGCGIPAHHLPHLFEVGFSGSGATSGLGLAVCDRLVRQLDGALLVESRVAHGTTFTLELPQA